MDAGQDFAHFPTVEPAPQPHRPVADPISTQQEHLPGHSESCPQKVGRHPSRHSAGEGPAEKPAKISPTASRTPAKTGMMWMPSLMELLLKRFGGTGDCAIPHTFSSSVLLPDWLPHSGYDKEKHSFWATSPAYENIPAAITHRNAKLRLCRPGGESRLQPSRLPLFWELFLSALPPPRLQRPPNRKGLHLGHPVFSKSGLIFVLIGV